MSTKSIGNLGEEIAEKFLINKGFKILERQFYAKKFGELDIIAEKNNHIHFIEVKTRSNRVFGLPEESITFWKKKKIKNSVYFYLHQKNILHQNFQIDCISIELDYKTRKASVRHIKCII